MKKINSILMMLLLLLMVGKIFYDVARKESYIKALNRNSTKMENLIELIDRNNILVENITKKEEDNGN